jgi:hypothetical protein
VVTDLHNFAAPLFRYGLGDYAEVGGTCRCGRTLPTFRRVLGRRRNLLMRADGSRFLPRAGFETFDEIAAIQQYQVIQHALDDIEFKLVSAEALSPAQVEALAATSAQGARRLRRRDSGRSSRAIACRTPVPASTRISSASSTAPPEVDSSIGSGANRGRSAPRSTSPREPALARQRFEARRGTCGRAFPGEQLDEGRGQRRLGGAAGDAG